MLFYFYFVLLYILVNFVIQYVVIGTLQFESYKVSRLVKDRYSFFKKNILVYLFFLVFIVLGVVFYNRFSNFLLVFCMMINGFLVSIFYIKQLQFSPIVFTKRICRLFVTTCLIDIVLLMLILKIFSTLNIVIYFNSIILLSFFIVFISYFINLPIEQLIAFHYIKLAKSKLNSVKNIVKIGITGSYGKTSVKEILASILSTQFSVVSTPKSYNTTMGISMAINSSLKNTTEVFVCEMGAKRSGEILELCNLVDVDMGIVTAVGSQHIETFGSVQGVYNTKKELPDYLQNKTCVFNLMNKFTAKMYLDYVGKKIGCFLIVKSDRKSHSCIKRKVKCFAIKDINLSRIFYCFPKKSNYYAKYIKLTENGSEFDVYYGDVRQGKINTNLLGLHNVLNIIMAIGVAMELSVPFVKVKNAIGLLESIHARLEKYVTRKGAVVINNGYNSNINSATSSLKVLNLFKDKTKVVITPGLIETGDDFGFNRKFGQLVGTVADEVIVVKDKNRDAIIMGLCDACFDMSKVYSVKSFFDARGVIDMAGENYVFLIENDLPDNFR